MADSRDRETVLFVAVGDGTGTKLRSGVLDRKGLDKSLFIIVLVDVELHVSALQATPAAMPAILVVPSEQVARVRDDWNSRMIMNLTNCRGKERRSLHE